VVLVLSRTGMAEIEMFGVSMKRILALGFSIMLMGAGPTAAQSIFDGAYAGFSVGYNDSTVERRLTEDISVNGIGPVRQDRSHSDLDLSGVVGEFYTGYGKTFGQIYVGGEVFAGRGHYNYERNEAVVQNLVGGSGIPRIIPVGTRTRVMDTDYTAGIAARLGAVVEDNMLVFGRVGYVNTKFNWQDTQFRSFTVPGAVTQMAGGANNFHAHGLLLGSGLELALTRSLFLRADYSFRLYEEDGVNQTLDMDFGIDGDIDIEIDDSSWFWAREHQFGLGLALRLNQGAQELKPQTIDRPNIFDGFYVGSTAGYRDGGAQKNGFEDSELQIPFTSLDLDRFNEDISLYGFSGETFAGYGRSFGRVYVGAEGLFDFGESDYDEAMTRDSGAGTLMPALAVAHWMTQDYSLGAAARLGWRANDSILLFGRGGYVGGQFEYGQSLTNILPSAATPAPVQDEFLNGFLVGAGAEWALNKWLRIRADYAYTHYEEMEQSHISVNRPGVAVERTHLTFTPRSHRIGVGLVLGVNPF
jgi:outer membrane immunogenic protein